MAVALDTAVISSGTNTWTSGAGALSWTHSASADSGLTNTIGLLFTGYESVATGTPTWGGANMTLITDSWSGAGGFFCAYIIVNPSYSIAGSTVSFTWSTGTNYHKGISMLVTGAKQSTTVDASNQSTASSSTTFAPTVTSVADNCMAFGAVYASGGATVTAGTDTTMAAGTGESITSGRLTNVKTPAGAITLNFNGNSGNWWGGFVTIAPPEVATNSNFFSFM